MNIPISTLLKQLENNLGSVQYASGVVYDYLKNSIFNIDGFFSAKENYDFTKKLNGESTLAKATNLARLSMGGSAIDFKVYPLAIAGDHNAKVDPWVTAIIEHYATNPEAAKHITHVMDDPISEDTRYWQTTLIPCARNHKLVFDAQTVVFWRHPNRMLRVPDLKLYTLKWTSTHIGYESNYTADHWIKFDYDSEVHYPYQPNPVNELMTLVLENYCIENDLMPQYRPSVDQITQMLSDTLPTLHPIADPKLTEIPPYAIHRDVETLHQVSIDTDWADEPVVLFIKLKGNLYDDEVQITYSCDNPNIAYEDTSTYKTAASNYLVPSREYGSKELHKLHPKLIQKIIDDLPIIMEEHRKERLSIAATRITQYEMDGA